MCSPAACAYDELGACPKGTPNCPAWNEGAEVTDNEIEKLHKIQEDAVAGREPYDPQEPLMMDPAWIQRQVDRIKLMPRGEERTRAQESLWYNTLVMIAGSNPMAIASAAVKAARLALTSDFGR